MPRYTAASRIGNRVISLLWQLRCHCNPDHNKLSSWKTVSSHLNELLNRCLIQVNAIDVFKGYLADEVLLFRFNMARIERNYCFSYLTGLVVIFNYHLIERRLMFWWGFFCFCFAWWHFIIAVICSNVTILTPINLIYRQLVKISKDRGHPFGPLYDFRTSSDPLGPRGLKSQFWMRWKLGDHLRVHVCLSKRLILADCQGEGSEFLLHLFGESITKLLNDCRPFYLGVFIALFQFMFFFKLSF